MEAEVVSIFAGAEFLFPSNHEYEQYTLDILCLMALADAFGFEYGEFAYG